MEPSNKRVELVFNYKTKKMNNQKSTFIICIMYGQNTEYWCGWHAAKNDSASKLIENAIQYKTEADAIAELENVVKPFGEAEKWNVNYFISEWALSVI